MLYSYFRTALRSLLKNKVFSFLNVFGLAIGMACCMIIFQYVTYERSYDKFHPNHENLYRVQYNYYKNGETIFECAAAVPAVGKAMRDNFPEIEEYAIAYPVSGIVTYEGQSFRESKMQMATPSWLTMFNWPLLRGDINTVLDGPKKAVITESTAKKYFGDKDPIGKYINWAGGWLGGEYLITGIAADVPNNSHVKFDVLFSHSSMREPSNGGSETNWGWYDHNTYVSLKPGVDPKAFDARFAEYLYGLRGEDFEKNNSLQAFPLQAITDIHLNSNLLQESEPEENGDAQSVTILGILAIFILVIAWVNYINLASAKSLERAKEVGVRKVLGAFRSQLIRQFITESVLVNLIAAVISLLIVALALPYFNQLTSSPLSMALIFNSGTVLLVVAVFLAGAFLSGLYPAFVLSSFKPITVLKGKFRSSSSGNILRKILVGFQFTASVFLIAGTLLVYKQMTFLKNRDLGFDLEQTMVLRGPSVLQVDSLWSNYVDGFKNTVTGMASVESFSTSTNVPGDEIFWTNGAKRAEAPNSDFKTIYNVGIDYDYIANYEIELLAGRSFSKDFPTDTAAAIMNLAGVQFLGFNNADEALGQKISHGGIDKTIVGVLDNYNQMSLKDQVSPILYRLIPASDSFFSLKLAGGNAARTTEEVARAWDNFFPGNPMDYFYLDSFFNRQYANEDQFGTVFSIFSGLAIFVSCLGLFGLSAFSALQRTKEIGIRKVLGASVPTILLLLSKEYMWLIAVSVMVGVPLIYLFIDSWLDSFAYRTAIGWVTFAAAAAIVFVVAIVTVSFQTLRSARADPSSTLRYE